LFNFDTFQNDKLNAAWEFPQLLDLKPYSYYEVMEKEGRLDEEGSHSSDGEGEAARAKAGKEEQAVAKEGLDEPKDEEEELVEPDEDNCFEYKLVGVTVHSGSANAGHYWSVINTNRGHEEPDAGDAKGDKEAQQKWRSGEEDVWMEFNDSTVRDFQASKLKEECFGGDGGGSTGGGFGGGSFDGWGMGSSAYGKSGYMLFYERREKKPLELLEEPQEEEKQGEIKQGEDSGEAKPEEKSDPNQIDSKEEPKKPEPVIK
jgi:hypothetical protein